MFDLLERYIGQFSFKRTIMEMFLLNSVIDDTYRTNTIDELQSDDVRSSLGSDQPR